MPSIKKAIILAGGQKTRLSPLDKYRPAWMLPIVNKPLIEYTINALRTTGITEVMIAMSEHDSDSGNNPNKTVLQEYLKKDLSTPETHIYCHLDDKPRGTAGSLKDLEAFIGDDTFLVINNNIFIEDIPLDKVVEFHRSMNSVATVGIHKDDICIQSKEGIEIAPDSKIKSFSMIHPSMDKRSPWKSMGIYIFEPLALKFINTDGYMDIKEQLIPALQNASLNVYAYVMEGLYQCIDSVKDYINVQRDLLYNNNANDFHTGETVEVAEKVWLGKNVKISPSAYLLGPLVIGDGCTINDWTQVIGPAVIGSGCHISEGALIRESIVWDKTEIASMAKIEYSIIGEGSSIPDNFCIKNMIALNGLKIGDTNLFNSDRSVTGTIDLTEAKLTATLKHKSYEIFKRAVDFLLSVLCLVLALPLFLLIALLIKLDSSGRVFYTQKRCGKNGKLFGMIKFRTMIENAEKLQSKLASKNEIDGPMFKLSDDPRVTRVGKILRSTSLDELPQLLNVLKGEMSLVGPRPLIMDEMKFSPSWRDTRLRVKPGITGLWQIQGRSEMPFHEWIRYDVYYIRNQSLWLDIKILFKTALVVLKKRGAY
ncbi:MAG: exopolysaccharide biosynthesis polyprenyl glycosylphosphotransferase [Nitrospirae bacterium]|nr:exopolysaccharide biosynthesis polyprenyl glycosylphosphotransferase [Nitrospirota bacterium]